MTEKRGASSINGMWYDNESKIFPAILAYPTVSCIIEHKFFFGGNSLANLHKTWG